MLTFVWAESENGVIGEGGDLPWRLPSDMKFFKEVTLTGNVLMGRKTFESFPNGALKDRENYVLTRQKNYQAEGAHVLHTIEEALAYAKTSEKPLHIIGGESIFNEFLDEVDMLYRTVIHEHFEGDTHSPKIDYSQFELVSEKEGPVDEKNKYPHTFMVYKRKK